MRIGTILHTRLRVLGRHSTSVPTEPSLQLVLPVYLGVSAAGLSVQLRDCFHWKTVSESLEAVHLQCKTPPLSQSVSIAVGRELALLMLLCALQGSLRLALCCLSLMLKPEARATRQLQKVRQAVFIFICSIAQHACIRRICSMSLHRSLYLSRAKIALKGWRALQSSMRSEAGWRLLGRGRSQQSSDDGFSASNHLNSGNQGFVLDCSKPSTG